METPKTNKILPDKEDGMGVLCIMAQMGLVYPFVYWLFTESLLCACLSCVSYVTCTGHSFVDLKILYLGTHGVYLLENIAELEINLETIMSKLKTYHRLSRILFL